MNFLKKLLILPPIAIGVAIFIYMTGHKQAPKTNDVAEAAVKVRVVEVQKIAVVPRVHGFGAVVPGKQWVATSQVAGEIVAVHPGLKKGAILKAGTTIIEISPVDFELAITQAKANIKATQAKIAELGVNGDNTKALLALEQQALKIREGELARQRSLVKRGTVSRTAFDRETRDTVSQRKRVLDLENKLRLIPTQLEVQRQQVAVFQAQLESAKLNLARTRITLPFNARISTVNAEVAQFAQPGQVLAKADGVENAEIEAQVPVNQFFNFIKAASGDLKAAGFDATALSKMISQMGLTVKVKLETGGQNIIWDARFARISDTIDPKTRTVGIIAVVEGAYSKASPGERPPLARGMFVEVIVSARPAGTNFIVPRLALQDDRIFVVGKDNRLEIRQVKTGLLQDDLVIVSQGLAAGDKVVVSELSPAIKGMLLMPEIDADQARELFRQANGNGPTR
jgi:RND family efflux transporter MFP subunit